METRHNRIIANMQILHECHDSRDDHMQTRPRQRVNGGNAGTFDDSGRGGNEVEEIDMTEVLQHLSEIERMSSRRTDTMNQETRQCLQELERARWYDTEGEVPTCGNATDDVGLTLPDDDYLEDEWKDSYEKRKAAWKVEAKEAVHEDEATTGFVGVLEMQDAQMSEQGNVGINEMASLDNPSTESDVLSTTEQVIQKWTLNTEQRRAFEIVANHTALESQVNY